MINFDKIGPAPHPARDLIKKKNIPLAKVAAFLNLSYHHTSHVLSGHYKPSRKVKPKLDKLVDYLSKNIVRTK